MKINKLMQLLRDNAQAEGPAKVRCQANADSVDIYVYDAIDPYWGATAQGMIDALKEAGGKPVALHINSPGGDVFEGRAMAAAVAAYAGTVEAFVDGICASAATYLALAAAKVTMVEGALFMVHNSWTIAYGDKAALHQTADLLDKIDGTIAADYMRKTSASAEQVKAWMDAETWFTAEEAKAAGFIDGIKPNTQPADQQSSASAARWNLSAYANAPKLDDSAAQAALAAQAEAQYQSNRNRLRLLTPI